MFAKKQTTSLRNSTTDIELLKIWLILTIISGGWCFSSSVPPTLSVCRDMKPGHQPHKFRSDVSPFTVSTDITSVQSGEDVIVTLRGDKEHKFLGFYIQGRDEQNNIIGTFTANDNVKVHNCAGMRNNAAHHANGKIEKESVKITWKAPKSFQGSVLFLATFVKEYDTFWTKVKSNELISVTENMDQE